MLRNQLGRERHSIGARHTPEVVRDVFRLRGLCFDLITRRVVLITPADRLHLFAHGGREQQNLSLLRRLVDQAAHGPEESHVHHAVRLIEHDDAHLAQVHVTPGNQVLEPARAGHDDVCTTPQRLALRSVAGASVERDDSLGVRAQKAGQHLSHLFRQFAGRHQDERSGPSRLGAGGVRDQREAEGQRLAGSCRRLPTDVAPGQGFRNGRHLNRKRVRNSEVSEALRQGRANPEVEEGRNVENSVRVGKGQLGV